MTCPICKAETVLKFRPFCSKECKELDLHRWFSGGYRILIDEELGDKPSGKSRKDTTDGR